MRFAKRGPNPLLHHSWDETLVRAVKYQTDPPRVDSGLSTVLPIMSIKPPSSSQAQQPLLKSVHGTFASSIVASALNTGIALTQARNRQDLRALFVSVPYEPLLLLALLQEAPSRLFASLHRQTGCDIEGIASIELLT